MSRLLYLMMLMLGIHGYVGAVLINTGDYSISIPGYSGTSAPTTNTSVVNAPISQPVASGLPVSGATQPAASTLEVIYEVLPAVMSTSMGLKTWVLTPGLDEYSESFAWISKMNITSNKTMTEYNGGAFVSRRAVVRFAVQFIKAVGLDSQYVVMDDRTCSFSDVGSVPTTVQTDIQRACERGLIADEDVFEPNTIVSRAEFIGLMLDSITRMSTSTIMPRSQQFALIKSWAVTAAPDDSAFGAGITRREVALYLFRLRTVLLLRGLPGLIGVPEAPIKPDAGGLVSLDPAQQPEFIEARNWAQDEQMISPLLSLSTSNPYSTLTRGELAEMVAGYVLYAGLTPTYSDANGCLFTDIEGVSEVRRNAISLVCRAGYMGASSKTFRPNDVVPSYVMYVVLIRMIEGRQPENTTPRWRNYIKKAQSYGMTDGSVAEERLATLYEALMTLYQYDMSKTLLKQMNSNNVTNQLISTLQTNTGGTSALISLDMSLLGDGQFEQGFAEVMGKTYEVQQQAVKRYYSQAFVRYGALNNLDNGKKIGSVVFVVAQGRLVRGTMRIGALSYSISRDDNGSGLYRLQAK